MASGSPVAKTPSSQCRKPQIDPWTGNYPSAWLPKARPSPHPQARGRPTLCDPIDGSRLGSSVPGILEWVAIAFSVKVIKVSHSPAPMATYMG